MQSTPHRTHTHDTSQEMGRKRGAPAKRRHAPTQRRSRLPFNFRKALFVLPNLFTLSSIFCGFYAITLTLGQPTSVQLYQATLAVFFGSFFDMADGRVARLTRTQSDFGVQLDSLSDLVTFGVAPAVITYRWGLSELGALGIFAAFAYMACGALRLARFNVLAARSSGAGPSNFFIGLPIPLAAGVVISLIMFHQRVFAAPVKHTSYVVLLLFVLGYLMVSNIRYRSFKNVGMSPNSALTVGTISLGFAALALLFQPAFALLVFFGAYVALGLVEGLLSVGRRRHAAT